MIRTAIGIASRNLRPASGGRPLPRLLTWTLNFRCNARCSMCDSWRKPADDELDTARCLEAVRRLPTSITLVRLTGGEPFLKQDLSEIVGALESRLKPEYIQVTTNGFLTDRIVEFLEERRRTTSRRLHLLVSLDGPEELHNDIRGRDFAFRTATDTIRRLARDGKRLGVDVSVNQTVVDERGIHAYDELHAMLGEWGVPHQVVVAYAESATYSTSSAVDLSPSVAGSFTTANPIDRDLLESFFRRLDADRRELPWASRIAKGYYLEGIRSRILEGRGEPNPPCSALAGHMRILPNGDIPVCQFNSKVAGNILRGEFESTWNSEELSKWRGWVMRCRGCWAECEVIPSALLGGELASVSSLRRAFT